MKNNQINEEIMRNILLMKYDSKKTLSENRQMINEEPLSIAAIVWISIASAGAAAGLVSWIDNAMAESPASGTALKAMVDLGRKIIEEIGAEKTKTPGFDPEQAATKLYTAMYENDYIFNLGITEDEKAIQQVLTSMGNEVDLVLTYDAYNQLYQRDLVNDLVDSLRESEWAPVSVWIRKRQRDLQKLKPELQNASGNTENTGGGTTPPPTPGSDEELGCLKGISGYRYDKDRGEVILPSSDDGGYCIAYKNKGTQNFSSGKLVCFNADGQEHSTANYACENGVFTARNNKLKESRYFGSRRRITEIKVGGIDMNSSFSEKSGNSSSPSPGSSGGSTTPHRRSSGGSGGSLMTQAPSCDEVKSGSKEIKRGMKDGCVSTIQEKLKTNFPEVGSADGKFGGKTENAVKNFQSKNGLSSTGIVNKETYEKLFFEEKPKTIQDYVPGGSNTGGSLDLSTGV